jgi:hypothetical protein
VVVPPGARRQPAIYVLREAVHVQGQEQGQWDNERRL